MEADLRILRLAEQARAAEADAAARTAAAASMYGHAPEEIIRRTAMAAASAGAVLRRMWGVDK